MEGWWCLLSVSSLTLFHLWTKAVHSERDNWGAGHSQRKEICSVQNQVQLKKNDHLGQSTFSFSDNVSPTPRALTSLVPCANPAKGTGLDPSLNFIVEWAQDWILSRTSSSFVTLHEIFNHSESQILDLWNGIIISPDMVIVKLKWVLQCGCLVWPSRCLQRAAEHATEC